MMINKVLTIANLRNRSNEIRREYSGKCHGITDVAKSIDTIVCTESTKE
jgi:hypothetical protein